MCLFVNTKYNHNGKSLVAKENILVYKALEYNCGKYKTFYQEMPINFGDGMYFYKTHRLHKQRVDSGYVYKGEPTYCYRIDKGIHSFIREYNIDAFVECYKDWFTTQKHYAIIPKGSRFYIGEDGDIVSSNLIVFEMQKDYNKFVRNHKSQRFLGIDSYLAEFWHKN